MQIGEVIRKYRKDKNMTQEEMARRLGVTAPAVNKWEMGNSMPDITLLAPIARLLEISLDTLLSFREELTEEEIRQLIYEADAKLQSEDFEEAFQWARSQLDQYPNCEKLVLQIAILLNAWCLINEIPDAGKYENYIRDCFMRALDSKDEEVRYQAADSLYGFYLKREKYEKAEKCLVYFSTQNPERKRKQADIYMKTGRTEEAYKTYEELLFSGYTMMSMLFLGIYRLAIQERDMEKAHLIVEKQEALAKLFEMGEYREAVSRLDLATMEKDTNATIETMEKLLANIDTLTDFQGSSLYEHMQFQEVSEEFRTDMREKLLKCFQDTETFAYLKEDRRWQELCGYPSATRK